MEALWNAIKNIDYAGVPIAKIIAVVAVLTVTQVLRQVFTTLVVKRVERLTSKTETKLDNELIGLLKPSISWLILMAGLWIVQLILAENLGPQLSATINSILNLITVLIVAFVIYRSSSLLGQLVANLLLHTDSDLDDLLKPFLPKVFQAIAIIVIVIKISEKFLGASAAALVGLLGGAGITLGLLFKDLIYDWFCTFIIYSDNLYREGDWLLVSGIDGFTQVLDVGFRSTKLHIVKWGSILKMPNSRMITGIVENWSQKAGEEYRWGISWDLKIDCISADKTAKVCAGIREIPKSIDGLTEQCVVRFIGIEENARVIKVIAFVNNPDLYFDAEREFNLAILSLLEQEGINTLYVRLEESPEKYKEMLQN